MVIYLDSATTTRSRSRGKTVPQEPVTVRRLLLNLTLCFTLFFGVASAQDAAQPDPLFLDNTALAVTITAPLTTLVRERPKDDYLQGVFEYTGADGSAVKLDIEIRTRGHFRHANCDFPPLGLNFRKKQVSGTLFDQQNKLKLVVHCDNHVRFEQNVLREYLAYRIHNSITDLSYHVRLLRVTYVDSEGRRKDQVRYAYLIEHKNRLAARLGLDVIERERIKVSSIQGDQLNLTSVFQYLIGNTDFSPIAGAPGRGCCHNYVLFGNNVAPLLSIPYDFDQSGFVDAPYASPDAALSIRNVRQRLYRGRCVNNEHIDASISMISDRQDEILALVEDQEGLDARTQKKLLRYIDKYFDLVETPKKVKRYIIKKCV